MKKFLTNFSLFIKVLRLCFEIDGIDLTIITFTLIFSSSTTKSPEIGRITVNSCFSSLSTFTMLSNDLLPPYNSAPLCTNIIFRI